MATKAKGKSKSKSKSRGKGGMAFRGGISELMKHAHRIQGKLEKVKEELKDEIISIIHE